MKSSVLLLLCLFYSLSAVQCVGESHHFVRDPHLNHASFGTNSQKPLQAVRIDHDGVLRATDVLKQKLASDLNLPLRDLRIVDPSFPSQIQATFIARPNAIIFALENIKVVVKHNEAIIFSPRQAEVEEYIPALQLQVQTIRSGITTANSAELPRTVSMRFEHVVIEAALNVVCNNLFRKVRALSPAIQTALQGLQAESRGLDIIKTQVDELLPLKNQLDELKKRVQEVDRAIKEVLDNDEDMGMMHLEGESGGSGFDGGDVVIDTSEAGVGSEDVSAMTADVDSARNTAETNKHDHHISHDVTHPVHTPHTHGWLKRKLPSLKAHTKYSKSHPLSDSIHHTHAALNAQLTSHLHAHLPDATISFEMMLENYLNEIGWIASEVEEMSDQITNTEENVALQIDLLRNRILRFELSLSMCSFIVSCAALVTGVFGMNLLSGVEHKPVLFWAVSVALVVGMGITFGQLRSYGKREKLF